MTKKIILFDIDYTLFDTTQYKKIISQKLAQIVPDLNLEKSYETIEDIYYNVRKFGSFDPKMFARFFIEKFPNQIDEKVVEEIWWQKEIIQQSLYPEVVSVLTRLQRENFTLGIFSSGQTEFQLLKISLLEDFFHKDHIHIVSFKEEKIEELLNEYANEEVIVVDDYIEILAQVKKLFPHIKAIWMKRGRFAEKATMPENFQPDISITTLDELLTLVDNDKVW